MRRLPLLVERSLADAKVARTQLADNYGTQLQARLAGEGTTVSCRKGCHNCCYHPVLLTLLEGVTLYQWLESRDMWLRPLKEAFKAAAVKTIGLSIEVWSLSLLPCPLLKDGQCSAYDARPFSCRVTYSIGSPSECHPHTLGPGMLPKRELFQSLLSVDAPILRRHMLGHFRLPLAVAVLYGERIAKGDLAIEDCGRALWQLPE